MSCSGINVCTGVETKRHTKVESDFLFMVHILQTHTGCGVFGVRFDGVWSVNILYGFIINQKYLPA